MKTPTKKFWKKLFLYLSFAPFILVLILAIYYAITGFTFCIFHTCQTHYGLDAFRMVTLLYLFSSYLTFIFPVCICYIIYYFIDRHRQNRHAQNNHAQNNRTQNRHAQNNSTQNNQPQNHLQTNAQNQYKTTKNPSQHP